jgi:hypothetical protein
MENAFLNKKAQAYQLNALLGQQRPLKVSNRRNSLHDSVANS